MVQLYGRADLLSRAKSSVDGFRAGQGRLLLLAGEPGIGKSALAEHLARQVVTEGGAMAWGRCWEVGDAPAYWPWIQVFRELGMALDPFAQGMSTLAVDAREARFLAFDTAVRALATRASRERLVLVLDDLHAADVASLLLLLLLARQLRGSRMLVIGTYRDAELQRSAEVAELLVKIAREGEVLRLARLAREDAAEWARASLPGASEEEVLELCRLTEGHPLYMVEVLRLGPRRPAELRAGLSAVLDERMSRLSASARAVLEVAAVLGREVAESEVAATAGVAADAVHRAFEEAAASSVLEPAGEPERFRFSHVLLRDRIYAQMLPSVRAKLHFRAGEVTFSRSMGASSSAVFHFFEGRAAGSPERVVEVALSAAEEALSRFAFEEAAQLLRRAESVAEGEPLPDVLRARLQIGLAEALIRLGQSGESRVLCARAAELAERSGAFELLARAALVYGTELSSGTVDPAMNSLLRRALEAMPDRDSPLAARLMARLAAGLTPAIDEASLTELLGLMRQAITVARRSGDRAALLYVLQFGATVALVVPEAERAALMQESIDLATALEQPLVSLQILPAHVTGLLARGQRAQAEEALHRFDELRAASRQPLHRVQASLLRALFCALAGRFEEAEQLNLEARRSAERGGTEAGLRMCSVQRYSFAVLRSDPTLIAAEAEQLIAYFDWMLNSAPYVAWMLVGLGRRAEARERLLQIDLSPATAPPAKLMQFMGAAETCVLLGDVEIGKRAYMGLLTATDRMFFSLSPGALMGPIARTLGDLALLIGEKAAAVRHYDEAIEFCQRLGAPALLEACQTARARASLERGSSGVSRAAEREAPISAVVLEREGDVWALRASGKPALRLKHSKGLGYLHRLMQQPGSPMHVLDLAGIDRGAGDAGAILDAKAKQAYRQRLDDLREQLAEAEQFGDAARSSRVQAELDAIADQLAGAVGLGGRDRLAASAVERARVNVQRCLKDALERVAAADPALGRWLEAAVKSGTYCVYQPL